MSLYSVSVQEADFNTSEELDVLRGQSSSVGAVVNFVGLVRDINNNCEVTTIQLEHYPGMTEDTIGIIIEQAFERWSLLGVKVIHRVGLLKPCDQIVLVAVSSLHRKDAFSACEFIMDVLKTKAPFWKKELTDKGVSWLDTNVKDTAAAKRWAK